jgi:hypothetical protein
VEPTCRSETVPFSGIGMVVRAVVLLITRGLSHRPNCPRNSQNGTVRPYFSEQSGCFAAVWPHPHALIGSGVSLTHRTIPRGIFGRPLKTLVTSGLGQTAPATRAPVGHFRA